MSSLPSLDVLAMTQYAELVYKVLSDSYEYVYCLLKVNELGTLWQKMDCLAVYIACLLVIVKV